MNEHQAHPKLTPDQVKFRLKAFAQLAVSEQVVSQLALPGVRRLWALRDVPGASCPGVHDLKKSRMA